MTSSVLFTSPLLTGKLISARVCRSRTRPLLDLLPKRINTLTRMASQFRIVEHVVNCSHTREYVGATAHGDDDRPKLAVKQYIPLNNGEPQPGDVTIIGAHANGFPKVRHSNELPHFIFISSSWAHTMSRNCTNLYGMTFRSGPPVTDFVFVPFGLPTAGIKEVPAYLTSGYLETIVSSLQRP